MRRVPARPAQCDLLASDFMRAGIGFEALKLSDKAAHAAFCAEQGACEFVQKILDSQFDRFLLRCWAGEEAFGAQWGLWSNGIDQFNGLAEELINAPNKELAKA